MIENRRSSLRLLKACDGRPNSKMHRVKEQMPPLAGLKSRASPACLSDAYRHVGRITS